MNDAEKPPLGSLAYERIAQLLHKVDQERWPRIAAFRVSTFIPLSDPVPPRAPGLLLTEIREYASDLFKTEADHYQGFANDPRYRKWLSELEGRVLARVLDALEKIDKADPKMTLMAHGLKHLPMVESLREMLWELGNSYASKPQPARLASQNTPAPQQEESAKRTVRAPRMSACIVSPSAARKMEAYINAKGLDQAKFAGRAQTTDKTIRKFRHTGKVKRSILAGIAAAMGITTDELLS